MTKSRGLCYYCLRIRSLAAFGKNNTNGFPVDTRLCYHITLLMSSPFCCFPSPRPFLGRWETTKATAFPRDTLPLAPTGKGGREGERGITPPRGCRLQGTPRKEVDGKRLKKPTATTAQNCRHGFAQNCTPFCKRSIFFFCGVTPKGQQRKKYESG